MVTNSVSLFDTHLSSFPSGQGTTGIQRNDDAALQRPKAPPTVIVQAIKVVVVLLLVVVYRIVGVDLVIVAAVGIVGRGRCGIVVI